MKNTISKKINFLLILAILLGGGLSCTERFIDVESNTQTASNLQDVDPVQLVNAVYNTLQDWEVSSFPWLGISSIASDDADKGSVPGDTGADKEDLDNLNINSNLLSVREVYQGHFKGIQRANQALNRLPGFTVDNDLRNRLIGEAEFLRALFYFRLLQTYGGVPIIETIPDVNADPREFLKRASKENVYAFIEKDLREAIQFLPEKSEYDGANLGRASKGAAKALLAKVSMYQKKWDVVKQLTDEIIASGEYSLTPNYEDNWKEIGENNSESVFEVQARGGTPSAGVRQYSQVQQPRGVLNLGWGFNVPSQNLADSYEKDANGQWDKRRDGTIIFAGETLYDGRIIFADQVVNPMYNQKAYASQFTTDAYTGVNVKILRYAEVLLMNAEAATQVGGDAAKPLNEVRSRAGLPPKNAPTQADVWNERRFELAMEGDRYFDLVRQGRAGTVMRAAGKNFVDGKNEVFPIPQEEIDRGQGDLIQNPGY